jgi:hypothetical protein
LGVGCKAEQKITAVECKEVKIRYGIDNSGIIFQESYDSKRAVLQMMMTIFS